MTAPVGSFTKPSTRIPFVQDCCAIPNVGQSSPRYAAASFQHPFFRSSITHPRQVRYDTPVPNATVAVRMTPIQQFSGKRCNITGRGENASGKGRNNRSVQRTDIASNSIAPRTLDAIDRKQTLPTCLAHLELLSTRQDDPRFRTSFAQNLLYAIDVNDGGTMDAHEASRVKGLCQLFRGLVQHVRSGSYMQTGIIIRSFNPVDIAHRNNCLMYTIGHK